MHKEGTVKLHAMAADDAKPQDEDEDDSIDLDAMDEDDEEEEEEYSPDQEPSPEVESRDELTPSLSSTHPEDAAVYAVPADPVDTYDPADQLSELPKRDEATHSVGAALKSSRRAAR